MVEVILVLGGARSGKSRFGEQIVLESGKNPVYIATAQADDEEMRQRIRIHQNRREGHWQTIEVPFELRAAIEQVARADKIILVDCLTLWLSNLLLAHRDIEAACDDLCQLLSLSICDIVLVSSEVGLGIVPDNVLARRFRDASGLLNQHIAACAKKVYFVAAGLPLCLKG